MDLDTIACVFKAIANIGDSLPIDVILGGLEARRNVVRRHAYDFQQALQSKPSHSIAGQRILRNSMQCLLNRVKNGVLAPVPSSRPK